jgi:hypothetical protein
MCNKYKSPHDRALIAFASDVLKLMEIDRDWNPVTLSIIDSRAHALGLSTTNDTAQFRVIPRQRFRNPLEL